MDELLMHLIAGIFQLIGEFLVEAFGEAFLDLLLRGLQNAISSALGEVLVAPIVLLVLGLILGSISLLIFPVHFVRAVRLHGISLLVTPVMAGAVMGLVGAGLRAQDRKVVRLEGFSCGFALAFGMALIRLLYAR